MISLPQNSHARPIPEEALKLQLDYAWKWFSYHATQRVSMFNYFLIATGILANAYVSAWKASGPWVAFTIAALGAVISTAFCILDGRNWCLVKMGEDVLEVLERYYLFTEELKAIDGHTGQVFPVAILLREAVEEEASGKHRCHDVRKGKYKVWLRLIEGIVAGAFVLGAIFAAYYPQSIQP